MMEKSRRCGTQQNAALTRMPYTAFDLERAISRIAAGPSRLGLIERARYARHVGYELGLSPHAPSMRVVIQACEDYRTHGKFRFGT